ncbi:RHO1 GDP-GTP exchange protein 2 [Haplosporangium sp. Z 11]|nr:RHO1 GDP-GTP exchange protein 2 [Haplosporangium sp. Z 11]
METPRQEPSIGRNKAIRDTTTLQKLAQQLEYQRSLAQLSQGVEVEEEDGDEVVRAYAPGPRRNSEHSIAHLNVHPHPSQQHQWQQPPYLPQQQQQQQQQAPPLEEMGSDYSSEQIQHNQYPSNLSPYQTQNYIQQPPLQQQQQYQPYGQQYPYQNEGFQSGYPQVFPGPSPDSIDALHRASTGPATISSNWSQPSSPAYPPSPFKASFGIYGSSEDQFIHPSTPTISSAAKLLIVFNPGILSTIAVAFRQRMMDNEAKRLESANYGLEFPVTFTGKEAIDVVIELTKLDDRRHALAIARSLEQQLLFFGGGDALYDSFNDQYFFSEATLAYNPGISDFPSVPTGVFPYTTNCYSYECQSGSTACYSYLCPNRRNIESVLGRQNSDTPTVGSQEKVWANSVPASVLASASKKERNRQEAIFEVVNTEHNYIRDLELMEEIFITPLRAGGIVDAEKLETLIEDVFLNYKEIIEVNKKLLKALRLRQEEQPLVESIGDILLSHIVDFEDIYSRYVPRIAFSEFTYKKEEAQNPKFAKFLQDCTRHPEARRLGLRHFLGQPYQRIPRYPLLLSEVVKRTEENDPDRATVQEVIKFCTELGKNIDGRMPEGARQVRMLVLQDKFTCGPKVAVQGLKLSEKERQIHFECQVRRKAKFEVQMHEFRLFLFDHMLLLAKEKRDKLGEKDDITYNVSMNPIPLELLAVRLDDSKPASVKPASIKPTSIKPTSIKPSSIKPSSIKPSSIKPSSIKPSSIKPSSIKPASVKPTSIKPASMNAKESTSKYSAPVRIEHRGSRGRIFVLYMTPEDRTEFIEKVKVAKKGRQDVVSSSHIFQSTTIAELRIQSPASPAVSASPRAMDGKRIICSAQYLNVLDGKRRVVIGAEDGVYVGIDNDPSSFRLAMKDISVNQISVLEAYGLLLILTGKVLKAFNISCLDQDSDKSLQTAQVLGRSVAYFTAGDCAGKTLVISMRRKSANENHFSAYEPLDNVASGTQQSKGLFGKSQKAAWFKPYREFYVAAESSRLLMLSKMVCVVIPKGFEVLKLESLQETRVYPTRQNPEYDFLLKRPESVPMSMFKINANEFLMCYSDFAFTMTKKGNLAKKELIEWEGRPESFAMVHPYIIAFESRLIEIRHIETGALEQVILGDNIRLLNSEVDQNGDAVMQVLMSEQNQKDQQRIVRLTLVPPTPKTQLEPIAYQPKSSYTISTSVASPNPPITRAKTPIIIPTNQHESSLTVLSPVPAQSIIIPTNQHESSLTVLSPVPAQSIIIPTGQHESSLTVLSPLSAQSPSSTQSPLSAQSPSSTQSPLSAQSPLSTQSPSSALPPSSAHSSPQYSQPPLNAPSVRDKDTDTLPVAHVDMATNPKYPWSCLQV